MLMDTVINIVLDADISKTHKITFFFNYIKNINFCIPKFCEDIFGCGTKPSSTQNWSFFQVKWQGKILFKNRNQIGFKTFTEGWSDTFLPWKQIKGRVFVQYNATFRCVCDITSSWAQSKVISVRVNFERRLYVRKDITVDNFLHNFDVTLEITLIEVIQGCRCNKRWQKDLMTYGYFIGIKLTKNFTSSEVEEPIHYGLL